MGEDWHIEQYRPERAEEWDRFVEESRNGTFLLSRPYMDYHSDRFEDCSLLAFKNGRLRALLPANISADGILHSHQGLTYGGWVLPVSHFDGNDMLALFAAWEAWSAEVGISEVDYKPIPWIYHRIPSQEDLYLLFRYGARRGECNLSSTVSLRNRRPFNSQQRRNQRRGEKIGARVEETTDCRLFHRLLSECLAERHQTAPVHSADELELLRSRFPERIRFFCAFMNGEPHAGVCIYDCGATVHAQYIASTPYGRDCGLLALLFDRLMERYADRDYFDFGISNERHGEWLNPGLHSQKSGLGGSGVVYERYTLRFGE